MKKYLPTVIVTLLIVSLMFNGVLYVKYKNKSESYTNLHKLYWEEIHN